ncbi:MAG: carboxypeptidase-like regulatory domain-containing protein [Planctomycetota bacterium]
MQRSHLLVLLVALIAAAAAAVWLFGTEPAAPPIDPIGTRDTPAPATTVADTESRPASRPVDTSVRRDAAVVDEAALEDDPEIRAALTGFRGRVVDHRKQPVVDCGVRVYRGALDSLLDPDIDFFAPEPTLVPEYVAGETRTGEDGRFVLAGVWPRAFYVMFAGIGTDAPGYRLIDQSPKPGELLDLGDIVLADAAVATGTVVDEQGEPVAGALVRAVDLPGQLLSMVPVERFDPEGCVLVREDEFPMPVVDLPAWVKEAFDHLPIPTTRSAADGTFRLVGIQPGNNVVATTYPGLLGDVKPVVRFEPGEEKDLGRVRLREGEEVSVRVVDTAGQPVAGAQVIAATTTMAVPVDFGRHLPDTDDDGRVAALGFGRGRATVAARRSPGDPWVLAEPQPILTDVVVTLPAVGRIAVQVTLGGAVVAEPELRLLPGRREQEALTLAAIGFSQPVALDARERRLDDGTIVLEDVPAGDYVVLARSAGAAVGTARARVVSGTVQVAIALEAGVEYSVRVLGPEERPVRNASIYVQERGDKRRTPMPLHAGRTGADGRLAFDSVVSDQIRVTAQHPRYGAVHGECRLGQGELVLRLQEPGWIEGTLTANGAPVEPGKYTLVGEWRRGSSPRPAVDQVPELAASGEGGAFRMDALQPGTYRVMAVSSFDVLQSPGGVMGMAQSMWMVGQPPRVEVEVVSGQGAVAQLDIEEENYTGPTGTLFGTVMVNGRLAEGYRVAAWTTAGRRVAMVDASGRFDFGAIPVGTVNVSVNAEASMFDQKTMWNGQVELKEAASEELVLDLQTSSLSGTVVLPDGMPASGVRVRANGRPAGQTGGYGSWHSEVTDAEGRFTFRDVPAGVFELAVDGGGDRAVRGKLEGIEAAGSRPVTDLRLQLQAAILVRGRVDLSAASAKGKVAHSWITFRRADPQQPDDRDRARHSTGCSVQDGAFETWDLDPGRYYVDVHASVDDNWSRYPVPAAVVVPEQGIDNVLLVPVASMPR